MCKRSSSDPLLRLMFDRYQINLLAVPREHAEVGDVYVQHRGRVSTPGNIRQVLKPALGPLSITRGEQVAHLAGTTSDVVEAKVGLSLLEVILSAMGAGAHAGEVSAKYEDRGAKGVRFRFAEIQRDSIDVFDFGKQLADRYVADNAALPHDAHLFLTTATLRASSIVIAATDDSGRQLDVDLNALRAATANAQVSVSSTRDAEIEYRGAKPLVFGIEVYALTWEPRTLALQLTPDTAGPRRLRSSSGNTRPKRFILSDDDAEALVRLE